METLALISPLRAGGDYHRCRHRGPVFVLLGFPATAPLGVTRRGSPADSVLARARAAATLITKDGKRNLERFSQRYLIYDRSATLANVLLEHLHLAAIRQNVYQLVDVVGFGQDGNDGLSRNHDGLCPVENRHGRS